MRLVFEKAPLRRMDDLPLRMRQAMMERLKVIAAEPFAPHANVDRLQGERDMFRLRQGDWRVVYRVDRSAGEVRVLSLGPRGSVYR